MLLSKQLSCVTPAFWGWLHIRPCDRTNAKKGDRVVCLVTVYKAKGRLLESRHRFMSYALRYVARFCLELEALGADRGTTDVRRDTGHGSRNTGLGTRDLAKRLRCVCVALRGTQRRGRWKDKGIVKKEIRTQESIESSQKNGLMLVPIQDGHQCSLYRGRNS